MARLISSVELKTQSSIRLKLKKGLRRIKNVRKIIPQCNGRLLILLYFFFIDVVTEEASKTVILVFIIFFSLKCLFLQLNPESSV